MQGMAHYFGGKVVRAQLPMHGKTSAIQHDGKGIFSGLPQSIEVMRYHSLVAEPASLPKDLIVTATVIPTGKKKVETDIREVPFHAKKMEALNPEMLSRKPLQRQVEIMGLRHKKFPVEGIQFHPESFATEGGKRMLGNFLFTYK
jgi:anthranilate synthase component 2